MGDYWKLHKNYNNSAKISKEPLIIKISKLHHGIKYFAFSRQAAQLRLKKKSE